MGKPIGIAREIPHVTPQRSGVRDATLEVGGYRLPDRGAKGRFECIQTQAGSRFECIKTQGLIECIKTQKKPLRFCVEVDGSWHAQPLKPAMNQ